MSDELKVWLTTLYQIWCDTKFTGIDCDSFSFEPKNVSIPKEKFDALDTHIAQLLHHLK